jgi:hypothetical protein
MSRPPTIDIAAAIHLICAECARTTGRAVSRISIILGTLSFPILSLSQPSLFHPTHHPHQKQDKKAGHTNTHQNQKPRTEPSKVHNGIIPTLDKIIRVCASSTDPVWKRGEDVGYDDEEGEVFFEEGAGEDYEEESDC